MGLAQPVIQIRDATFRYGKREIFSGLDLDVFAGEVLTILGPNGCGKSTLLRCIGGVLALDQGTVRLKGRDIASFEANARARKIGFLFQQHTPAFPFAVLDVVSMGRAPHLGLFGAPSSKDIALAEQALERLGLFHLKDQPYTELSGGERQLVLIARTLVQEAEIILLDEPTSHLDFKNQVLSLRTIGALAEQGITMIMTTHDPNHASLFPGKVVLMNQAGRIETGSASEVLTSGALAATYGIEIAVYTMPRRDGLTDLILCNPW